MTALSILPRRCAPLLLAALATGSLVAQCQQTWAPGFGLSGVHGYVRALVRWDRDGAGPAQPVLVLAGNFDRCGTTATNRVAIYDPATGVFAPLGSGMDQDVWCLAASPQGELYAGGHFTTAGGVPARRVARWAGTDWAPLGSGLGGTSLAFVYALAVLPNGNLVAGGDFPATVAQPNARLAQWNGTGWAAVGGGVSGPVFALSLASNGDLLAGGPFNLAGGGPANGAARWNGTTWSGFGPGPGLGVFSITGMPNGDVVVGGTFPNANDDLVRRWNGTSWTSLGLSAVPSTYGQAFAVAVAGNGDLCVGGQFDATPSGPIPFQNGARWDGVSWVHLAGSAQTFAMLDWPGLGLIAGGGYYANGGRGVAAHNGTAWRPLGRGTDAVVRAVALRSNGEAILGGDFTTSGGIAAAGVVVSDGVTMTALGSGVALGSVAAVLERSNGDIVVAGTMTSAGGVVVRNIAAWNGTTWSAFAPASGLPLGSVTALAELSNGDLVAAGFFGFAGPVARWNGAQWVSLGSPAFGGGSVRALLRRRSGDLVAAGDFVGSNGMARIASWNGASWSSLASGLDGPVYALAELPDGDLIVGGDFQFAGATFTGRLARWNGASWSPYPATASASYQPNLAVRALAVQVDGSVLVGGDFTQPADHLALVPAAGPLFGLVPCSFGGSPLQGSVLALATNASGVAMVVGDFVGSSSGSEFHARLRPIYPATTGSYGAGCNGAVGLVSLAATSQPWLGTTYEARSTGLPSNAIVVEVLGLSPVNVPLGTLLPQGLPGCTLLANLDALAVLLPSGGAATTQIPVTANLAGLLQFSGLMLHNQHVVLETGPGGILAVTSSNGLALQIGQL